MAGKRAAVASLRTYRRTTNFILEIWPLRKSALGKFAGRVRDTPTRMSHFGGQKAWGAPQWPIQRIGFHRDERHPHAHRRTARETAGANCPGELRILAPPASRSGGGARSGTRHARLRSLTGPRRSTNTRSAPDRQSFVRSSTPWAVDGQSHHDSGAPVAWTHCCARRFHGVVVGPPWPATGRRRPTSDPANGRRHIINSIWPHSRAIGSAVSVMVRCARGAEPTGPVLMVPRDGGLRSRQPGIRQTPRCRLTAEIGSLWVPRRVDLLRDDGEATGRCSCQHPGRRAGLVSNTTFSGISGMKELVANLPRPCAQLRQDDTSCPIAAIGRSRNAPR